MNAVMWFVQETSCPQLDAVALNMQEQKPVLSWITSAGSSCVVGVGRFLSAVTPDVLKGEELLFLLLQSPDTICVEDQASF